MVVVSGIPISSVMGQQGLSILSGFVVLIACNGHLCHVFHETRSPGAIRQFISPLKLNQRPTGEFSDHLRGILANDLQGIHVP